MNHPIVHIELSAKDHSEASEWYKQLFGWEIRHIPEMDYSTADPGNSENFGMGFNPITDESPAGTVVFYIHTDDVAASVKQVRDAGGEILVEDFDIPTVGTMATFKDPSGNIVSLLQPAPESA